MQYGENVGIEIFDHFCEAVRIPETGKRDWRITDI